MAVLALPTKAQTSAQAVILSNEFPGNALQKLAVAGYVNLTVYQTLQQIVNNANPSISSIITPAFLNELASAPAPSQIFTSKFGDYVTDNSIEICTDGTVQQNVFTGSTYYGTAGTSSLDTQVSGIADLRVVYSSTQAPLVSFTMGTVTYGAFAILYVPATSATANPNPAASSTSTSTTSTPTPTPAVPEFPTLAIILLSVSMLSALIIVKKEKLIH